MNGVVSTTVTKFSVNLNKIALLRNSRGRNLPDLSYFARRCLALGVHGVTVHPRPDERHTRYQDVRELASIVGEFPGAEFNVEGKPNPRFTDLVLEVRPHQVTLVPDAEQQLTSDHGWDVVREGERLACVVADLRAAGIRTSLFLDPSCIQVEAAAKSGADRIELYTETYASAFGGPEQTRVLNEFTSAAVHAARFGLGVNAGHDLSLENLSTFLAGVPGVLEVSIGHAVICESLERGLESTLRGYLDIVARAASERRVEASS